MSRDFAAGDGMDSAHLMCGHDSAGILANLKFHVPVLLGMGSGFMRVVKSAHLGKHGLHAVRKGLPDTIEVGEQRVAADRRRLDVMEHGTQRRFPAECHVDMPVVTEVPDLIGHLYDLDELGIAFDSVNEGILLEIPEPPREIQLLNGRQGLVAKEDDKMIVEGLADGGPCRAIERLR